MSRLSVAPFRSLVALSNPLRAAERAVRILVWSAGCSFACCDIPELDIRVVRGASRSAGEDRTIVDVPGPEGPLGRIEVNGGADPSADLSRVLAAIAHTLGTLVAIHRHALLQDGVIVSPSKVHFLANIVNSLRMQLLVAETLFEKGRAEESRGFIAKAVSQCDRLEHFVAGLRSV